VIPDIEFPDFYDAYEDIGESSLDGALPWDTVRPVEYRAYHPIQASVPQLKSMHEERAKTSPDFIYLLGQIERTRELRDREEISLNESVVKQEREDTRRQEFEAENMRRALKGLPLEEWEDEIADEEDEVVVSLEDSEVASEDDEEEDPLILESGRILADYIKLNGRRVTSR
jgi:carboxyl-terminal processing protease